MPDIIETQGLADAIKKRNSNQARRVMNEKFPFRCCAICGLQVATCLQIAHLDHDASNNAEENLARLCPTHHWMYDCGLYPLEAIRLLQAHWQETQGIPEHKARMKDAGVKALATRRRRASAVKAEATRKATLAGIASGSK
jgi:predicted restriction endonuclease